MRVVVQHIFDEGIRNKTARGERLWAAFDAYLRRFARIDVDIRQNFLAESTSEVYNRYCEHTNEGYIVEALLDQERQGAEATVIACIADPGLQETRSVLSVPVIGAGEASVALAQLLGKRFAIIVVRPEVVPMVERRLDYLHAYGRAIHRPVRSIDHWSYDNLIDTFEGTSSLLLEEFERVARACIEDGADVIVSGCAYVGPVLTERGLFEIPGTGVPVVDCTASAIQLAVLMGQSRAIMPSFQPSRAPHSPYVPPKGWAQQAVPSDRTSPVGQQSRARLGT